MCKNLIKEKKYFDSEAKALFNCEALKLTSIFGITINNEVIVLSYDKESNSLKLVLDNNVSIDASSLNIEKYYIEEEYDLEKAYNNIKQTNNLLRTSASDLEIRLRAANTEIDKLKSTISNKTKLISELEKKLTEYQMKDAKQKTCSNFDSKRTTPNLSSLLSIEEINKQEIEDVINSFLKRIK